MSRYENGIHEPPVSFVQKHAQYFKVPTAYFYCDDEQLAEVFTAYPALSATAKQQILEIINTG